MKSFPSTGSKKKTLELGCGPHKHPGVVAMDVNPSSDADVIHDLNEFPYPFDDNTFDEVICEHVLEHLDNLIQVIEELHRICRPGALIKVDAPYYSSTFYYRDPTHRTFFSVHTFDYFIPGTAVYQFRYSKINLKLRSVEFPVSQNAGLLKRLLFRWINQHKDFYEHNLAFVLPRHLIRYELEVIKEQKT